MIELETDDAFAAAALIASKNLRVEKICIWTPDKDFAQCVQDGRIVQVDRRSKTIRDADGVRSKFGISPAQIADFLALVGDSADGYPGITGIGSKGAARLFAHYRGIEDFLPEVLGDQRDLALLLKKLAVLQTDAPLLGDVDELQWLGPKSEFSTYSERFGVPELLSRANKVAASRAPLRAY